MTGEQVTRRVYSAEQLHRLRVSCSQPRLQEAIEEHDGEDAELVKEHVLRGTKSFTARSFRSRASGKSLRVPSNKENRSTADGEDSTRSSGHDIAFAAPVLGEFAANNQILRPGHLKSGPSPTPSLKKKKAEAIVKAHGSPQHVRVTAGGRIVPSDQSPLCHPRYGYSAIKANGGLIKFAPNHPVGKAQWTQATQNGFVAQDINGRLCQIVNGTILPLNEVDGALRLYIPAPNITSRAPSFGPNIPSRISEGNGQQRTFSLSKPVSPPDPPLPTQTHALELEYSKLEHELKELDKTEVLHGRTMGKAAKEALVAKRRDLVITLDNIRKAIKSIKSIAPTDPPASPRPVRTRRQSTPPPAVRVPTFVPASTRDNHEVDFSAPHNAPGPFFPFAHPHGYGGEYGFHAPAVMDAAFGNPMFAMQSQQPPLFVPPPPFDGSVAPAFVPAADQHASNLSVGQSQLPLVTTAPSGPNNPAQLPQNDGAGSIKDVQKAKATGRSHAVDIKPPESKAAAAIKSNLNPMSPAYKPTNGVLQRTTNRDDTATTLRDRAPTPLSPMHQLKPIAASGKEINNTDDTLSPTKKSPHLHSSSVSSFETADFFPRNTREYSTRKYAYPRPLSPSEDKENVGPGQLADTSETSPVTAKHAPVQQVSVDQSLRAAKADHAAAGKNGEHSSTDNTYSPMDHKRREPVTVPDRRAHNLSPKGRRPDHFSIHEDPSDLPALPASSPEKPQPRASEARANISCDSGKIDYSEASVDWIEGYRAGLARRAVEADRAGEFLDGYCAGLLKSKPKAGTSTSTGDTSNQSVRRPSPVVIQPSSSRHVPRDPTPTRSPFENNIHSMDTLKEAVFSPSNEEAVMSPAVEGPVANDPPFNLGAWAKKHDLAASAESLGRTSGDGLAGFPFPYRPTPMNKRQGIMSDDEMWTKNPFQRGEDLSGFASIQAQQVGGAMSPSVDSSKTAVHPPSTVPPSNRVVSLTYVDPQLYSQWPGARVFSNQLEWKSASSVAQAAGLASGHFANAHLNDPPNPDRPMSIMSSPTIQTHSRFKEGSLDGITNPPNSPQPCSPPMSPSPSSKDRAKKSKTSPTKYGSPSKSKLENMAEKVGIKVSGGANANSPGGGSKKDKAAATGGSPNSPLSKRGWREVWRSSRKDQSKDDGAPQPSG